MSPAIERWWGSWLLSGRTTKCAASSDALGAQVIHRSRTRPVSTKQRSVRAVVVGSPCGG
ncbi:Hypothetical protein A7982_00184 [Minicystis rosea]|nr:Hypothetical protein A7982_00184 [Minicystis rosea]